MSSIKNTPMKIDSELIKTQDNSVSKDNSTFSKDLNDYKNTSNSNRVNRETSDKKLITNNSYPYSDKSLSSSNFGNQKNCPEIEKYINRLKKININDKETQNNLNKCYSIIKTNKPINDIFNRNNEILSNLIKKNTINNKSSIDSIINNPKLKDYKLLNKLKLHDLINLNLIDKTTEITDFSKTFSNENIRKIFEQNYFSEINKLNGLINSKIENLQNIVSTHKTIETDINVIIDNINKKENDTDSMLTFNEEFFNSNKNYLIRNQILNKFLHKIIMTKEEKNNLLNKNLFDEKFFTIIKKLFEMKYCIKILERNSEKFSKNLIFSIKENFNIMDDLMNEKIVLYVKEVLRDSEKFFADKNLFNNVNPKIFYRNLYKEFSKGFNIENWIIALSYISEKENYKNFIIKEYVNSRKKIVENTLKQKYMKINKIEAIFDNLIVDSKILYLKEFLLFQVFFGNSIIIQTRLTNKILSYQDNLTINEVNQENANNSQFELKRESSKNLFFEENLLNLNNKEKKILFDHYFNSFYFAIYQEDLESDNIKDKNTSNSKLNNILNHQSKEVNDYVNKLIEDLTYIRSILKPKFTDTNFSINYLNQILYILEEIYYDNVRFLLTTKNLEKDMNQNYKMLLLSDVFEHNIDTFFSKNEILSTNFDFNQKLKNNSINIINLNKNYKKQFANNSVKLFNENFKFLEKINRAAFDLLFETENSVADSNSENSLIKSYYNYMEDYYKLFSDYQNYISQISNFNINNKEYETSVANMNPKNQNAFKLLTEFFNQDSFKKQRNKNLILRTLNLLNSFLIKFKVFDEFLKDELNNISKQIEYFKSIIVEVYFEEILKLTEFDKNLEKIISHEQAINLIQLILEKSIFIIVF